MKYVSEANVLCSVVIEKTKIALAKKLNRIGTVYLIMTVFNVHFLSVKKQCV